MRVIVVGGPREGKECDGFKAKEEISREEFPVRLRRSLRKRPGNLGPQGERKQRVLPPMVVGKEEVGGGRRIGNQFWRVLDY